VSLILDALKKLEREKEAREPNVLVVGSVPWGARARSRLPLAAALAAIGLVVLVTFVLWPRARPADTATPSAPASSSMPALDAIPPTASPAPPARPADLAPPERRPSVPGPGPRAEAPLSEADEGAQTSPDSSRTSTTEDLRLNAISQRDGRPVALINDRLVFEGDSFDGVEVLRIGESEVEVEVRGRKRILRF
jgi:hypothetical protein